MTEQNTHQISGKEAFHSFNNRCVYSDQFGRRRKTEHTGKDGSLLFTDVFKYESDKAKRPYEMKRTYEGPNGQKTIDTFTTHLGDEKSFVFYRIKSQMYRNGEKVRTTYYDPETQGKTKERIFRRDKNSGLLLMTENLFNEKGKKISMRRMVNLGGRYYERSPEVDKKLHLNTRSTLRATLGKRQTVKAIKAFFDRLRSGKSA